MWHYFAVKVMLALIVNQIIDTMCMYASYYFYKILNTLRNYWNSFKQFEKLVYVHWKGNSFKKAFIFSFLYVDKDVCYAMFLRGWEACVKRQANFVQVQDHCQVSGGQQLPRQSSHREINITSTNLFHWLKRNI